MRILLKIVAILFFLTAVFAVIACNHMNSPESGSISSSETYTVVFDSLFSNDGSITTMPSPTTSITVNPGQTVGTLMPSDPRIQDPETKEDKYIFGGWYTDANATGTRFTESTPVIDNIRVYAFWFKYLVIFISDGTAYAYKGTTPSSPNNINELPAPPTKTGNTFAGWWTAENGGGAQFFATTIVNDDNTDVDTSHKISDKDISVIKVYAKWIPNALYAVTYDSDGGTAVGTQYVISGNTVGTFPTAPAKSCYVLDAEHPWWRGKNGGVPEFKTDTPVTDNIVVYAKWSTKPVPKVTFNSGWGTSVEPRCVTSPTNTLVTPPEKPLKPCYDFVKWTKKSDGSGGDFDENTSVTTDTTVYAQWNFVGGPTKSTYTIGDTGPHCGKVFYINGGGLSGPNGLEAAPPGWYDPYADNADPQLAWISGDPVTDADGNVTQQTQTTLNGKTSTAIGTGLANSEAIITQSNTPAPTASSFSPAQLCKDYRGGDEDGWFLPSKDELAQLYAQRDTTRWGGFDPDFYWSSSEYDRWNAWSQSFFNGKQNGTVKTYERSIRPVHAFP